MIYAQPRHTPECFAHHMGLWAVEERRLRAAVAHLKRGAEFIYQPSSDILAFVETEAFDQEQENEARGARDRRSYDLQGGVAIIPILGGMTKGSSKYGTSILETRRSLRAAVNDQDVKAIFMPVDSPGGQAGPTEQLSADVRKAASSKPVHVHVDDLSASAAVWGTAHATKISANPMSEIGSIGVFAVIHDTSSMAEMKGIEVHVLSTGKYKGQGIPGTEVSKEFLAEEQRHVDRIHSFFLRDVRQGRGIDSAVLDDIADGRTFGAEEAQGYGLIDEISSMSDSFAALQASVAGDFKGRSVSVELERKKLALDIAD